MLFSLEYNFIVKLSLGVDRCWCACRSSKPFCPAKTRVGGFDSHIFPPIEFTGLERIMKIFLRLFYLVPKRKWVLFGYYCNKKQLKNMKKYKIKARCIYFYPCFLFWLFSLLNKFSNLLAASISAFCKLCEYISVVVEVLA